jgi:hypothetical protein
MTNENRIDRRRFAESLAAGSSAFALLMGSSLSSNADDKPAVEPKEVPAAPARPSEEVLLLTCLMQRYPSEHFDEAAIQGIYRDLRGDLARGKILSEFPLENSDEPCFEFRAFRAQH